MCIVATFSERTTDDDGKYFVLLILPRIGVSPSQCTARHVIELPSHYSEGPLFRRSAIRLRDPDRVRVRARIAHVQNSGPSKSRTGIIDSIRQHSAVLNKLQSTLTGWPKNGIVFGTP